MTTYMKQLRRVPGLGTMRPRELADIARLAERVDARAGQAIVGTGDRWTGACIIERGEAVAQIGGWTFVLPAGARVVRAEPSAPGITVTARSDVRALLIGRSCRANGSDQSWARDH